MITACTHPIPSLLFKKNLQSWVVVAHTLITALVRQRQADRYKFKASQVYRVSFRTGRATETEKERDHVSKKQTKNLN